MVAFSPKEGVYDWHRACGKTSGVVGQIAILCLGGGDKATKFSSYPLSHTFVSCDACPKFIYNKKIMIKRNKYFV